MFANTHELAAVVLIVPAGVSSFDGLVPPIAPSGSAWATPVYETAPPIVSVTVPV
jgi:hypothetical protein